MQKVEKNKKNINYSLRGQRIIRRNSRGNQRLPLSLPSLINIQTIYIPTKYSHLHTYYYTYMFFINIHLLIYISLTFYIYLGFFISKLNLYTKETNFSSALNPLYIVYDLDTKSTRR